MLGYGSYRGVLRSLVAAKHDPGKKPPGTLIRHVLTYSRIGEVWK